MNLTIGNSGQLIKTIEYYPNGQVKRVDYYEPVRTLPVLPQPVQPKWPEPFQPYRWYPPQPTWVYLPRTTTAGTSVNVVSSQGIRVS